ncbi:calcium-transporting P-type ATPase, PMR1-type [Candidatus Woesearchaeota archaeon]|nr:calcium-transporting P-type ATPase, PMR1-type [Candidatus Woesearchaeota archaeon]
MEHHSKPVEDVLLEFSVSPEKGLTKEEAARRLQQQGYNEIEEKEKISAFKIFLSQFVNPVVWILLGAIIISVIIHENIDAMVIAIILIMNAILGFAQEYRAEKAIEALKKMASLKAKVIRDGTEQEIDARELVPGDVIFLDAGDKIPADARLIRVVALHTQEAALTGESLPVRKIIGVCPVKIGIADCSNMVFAGTIVTNGKALAVVVATGMKTEIGKIAHLIQTAKPESTPLQKKLARLARWLSNLTVSICAIVFLVGVIRGGDLFEFLLTAVSLAVAAIPEGLPIVVTIAMALGVQRMVKRNALIRKLPSVETLGCTTVICTDKTGTLTHNQMTVKKVYVDSEIIDVTGSGYKPEGSFTSKPQDLELLLRIGVLNNDAKLDETKWEVIGDPTEGALIVSAVKYGLDKQLLSLKYKRGEEIPFSSERKRMTTVHQVGPKRIAYMKGAPDVVLHCCSFVLLNGKVQRLTKQHRDDILHMNEQFASDALRVLGFAYKEPSKEKTNEIEKDMVFVGLQGMMDPPREEVKEAIAKCKRAGIKVVMITGDHQTTAVAVAKELGIEGKSITGQELEHFDISEHVENIAVYARVDPRHKIYIVDAFKKRGHIVAMTGDGVNDAPALKRADIGIAMGVTGTDVAKEASGMILTDDNFASIVNAVEEGRGVYDNIQKFLAYLLSGNIAEVLVVFFAVLFGLSLPFTAIQILWVNLVTDGLPALALGVDPIEQGIMERPPRKPKMSIFEGLGAFLIAYPILVALGILLVFSWFTGENLVKAQTMAFTIMVFFELFQAISCRSITKPVFKVGLLSNRWLLLAITSSIALHLAILYVPFFHDIFGVTPLSVSEWGIVLALASIGFIMLELQKVVRPGMTKAAPIREVSYEKNTKL